MKLSGTQVTSLELEARVVGAILRRGDSLYELPAGFNASVLENDTLRRAFEGIERLSKQQRLPAGPVDHALLVAEAGLTDEARNSLRSAEAQADSIFTRGTEVRDHAGALLDRRRKSNMRALFANALQELEAGVAPENVSSAVTATLLDLDGPEKPETISYQDAFLATVDAVERVKTAKERVLRTGFPRIDSILRIRRGNLVIVAARSKIGKTIFGRQVADDVALRHQHVLFHSLEMDIAEVVALDLSRDAEIDSAAFFDDKTNFTSRQWADILAAGERRTAGTTGYLHANHHYASLGAICRISEKMHRKYNLALIVIDYIQLVEVDLGRGVNREQQVSTISRTLKRLAQRLGVPILALAQLNRDAAKRAELMRRPKRAAKKHVDPMALPGMASPPAPPEEPPEDEPAPPPQVHDLRESGALEQDANAVCLIHHPYDLAANPEKRDHGPFQFIIASQRLGPKGTVKLYAERNFSRFVEIE